MAAATNIIKIKDAMRRLAYGVANDFLPFEQFSREFTEAFSKRPRKVEHRNSDRIELPPIPAEVQPLGDDLEPNGDAFFVMVRNISPGGIGLMFGEDTPCRYLQLQVDLPSGKKLRTVIEVKHCTAAGIMIGGSQITELQLW